MNRLTAGMTLCLLAGCGSGTQMMTMDSGMTPDSGPAPMATLTATGALTGTIMTNAPVAGYDADTMLAEFSLTDSSTGTPFTVDINYTFGGIPMIQAYMDGTGELRVRRHHCTRGTGSDAGTTADTWVARDNVTSGANAGTCTLSLSAVNTGPQGYILNGTLTVTAPNMGGASTGSVMLTGTF